MPHVRTHYDNLQVKENASIEVIKGAYKHLSQKWHPDKHPHNREHAERVLKIINQAYEVLSDPARRREHDRWINDQSASTPLLLEMLGDAPPIPDPLHEGLDRLGISKLSLLQLCLLWGPVLIMWIYTEETTPKGDRLSAGIAALAVVYGVAALLAGLEWLIRRRDDYVIRSITIASWVITSLILFDRLAPHGHHNTRQPWLEYQQTAPSNPNSFDQFDTKTQDAGSAQ